MEALHQRQGPQDQQGERRSSACALLTCLLAAAGAACSAAAAGAACSAPRNSPAAASRRLPQTLGGVGGSLTGLGLALLGLLAYRINRHDSGKKTV